MKAGQARAVRAHARRVRAGQRALVERAVLAERARQDSERAPEARGESDEVRV